MHSISTSVQADDSLSISTSTTSAPVCRLGRPRIHKNDSEKKAAYRERKFQRKLRASIAASTRWGRKVQVPRDPILDIKEAYLNGNVELALALLEKFETQVAEEEYNRQIAKEEERDAKPVKHNRTCKGPNACLCDLSMSRGMYLTDAPRGKGLLVYSDPIALISDAQQVDEECGGKVSGGHGWDAHSDENTDYKHRTPEHDWTFIERTFQDSSWLRCYIAGCKRLPWGILPEDHDKPQDQWRYCCDLHKSLEGNVEILPRTVVSPREQPPLDPRVGTKREVTPGSGGIRTFTARPHSWGKHK